jgi:hypothetical protein
VPLCTLQNTWFKGESSMGWSRYVFLIGPMVLGFIVAISVLYWSRRSRLLGRRSPLTQGLLRPPGHALRNQFDDTFVDIMTWMMVAIMMPAYVGALYVGGGQPIAAEQNWVKNCVYLTLAIGMIALSACKLVKLHTKAMRLRMGWDAEMAAGQELDQLMRRGAAVFHDLQTGSFNIDHVLICSAGVFAVETKSRRKPKRGNRDGAKVTYDGTALYFPDWIETEPIEQSRSQARWLATELSKVVGEPVQVSPVLALPGWFVNEKRRADVRVMNPKNFHFLLESREPLLPRAMVDRIAYQVEQRCRDLPPAYEAQRRQ